MDSAPEFLNLFVEPTGELIYFLAVIAISQAVLLMALGQRVRGPNEVAAGRYTVLLAGIVLTWLGMMVGGLYVVITDTPDEAILPPLERAINALVIVLAGTALLTADRPGSIRGTWRILLLITVLLVAAYAYTAIRWEPLSETNDFNSHILGFAWTLGPALLIFGAIWLLLTRYNQTADVPLKLIFFVVLLIGYSYTLARMSAEDLDGHTSGALRLGFLAALPMLGTAVYRLVLERLSTAIDEVSEYAEAISRPQPAIRGFEPGAQRSSGPAFIPASESMTLLKAMGLMLEKEDPDEVPRQIVTAVATVLKADVAALASSEDDNWADVIAAYDHVNQHHIPGLALNLDQQPTIRAALDERMQHLLRPGPHTDELVDLYTRLDIGQMGPAYVQPLLRAGQIVGIMIVGLPYSDRELSESECSLLEGLAPISARLLSLARASQQIRLQSEDEAIQAIIDGTAASELDGEAILAARKEMESSLRLAQEQIGELSRMVRDLQVELDYERSRLAQLVEDGDEALTISQRIEALSTERQQLSAERELLSQALQEAQATLVSATGEGDESGVYGSMIEALRRERDELLVQKTKLERHLEDVRSAREAAVPGTLRTILEELSTDKARLAAERETLQAQLDNVQSQLKAMGIEGGPLAVAQALAKLTEERMFFKTQAERIAQERDLLIRERAEYEDKLQREAEREAQLIALEADIRRLATDREALIRQRDTFHNERDDLLKNREEWVDQRARLLAEVTGLQAEIADAVSDLNQITASRKNDLQAQTEMEAERDRLLAKCTALQTERDQLMARLEGNRELLEQLGADGVGTLKQMIDDLTAERAALESELLQTQQDLAQVDRRRRRPASAATQHMQPVAPENAEVIMSIAQELRTPMSSIRGYTDLMLSESVGILGALQRQFLQRVQANIDRLEHLVQDLISITILDSEDFELTPITVNMLDVIEDAITRTGNQFRERNITLHMNLADDLPELHADQDAMHQVLLRLLSNAYLASPPNGEVTITTSAVTNFAPPCGPDFLETGEPIDGIYVSVADQGGGVSPEEQRRVFGRLYRADNPLIEGLGDTGVGLSIAKTLIEAHRGSIWLESTPGKGSTFQFVIPLSEQDTPAEE